MKSKITLTLVLALLASCQSVPSGSNELVLDYSSVEGIEYAAVLKNQTELAWLVSCVGSQIPSVEVDTWDGEHWNGEDWWSQTPQPGSASVSTQEFQVIQPGAEWHFLFRTKPEEFRLSIQVSPILDSSPVIQLVPVYGVLSNQPLQTDQAALRLPGC